MGGPPVRIEGRPYFDGGLAEAIPDERAVALGASHVLVLQTRPWGVPRAAPPRLADRLVERELRRHNPALVDLYRRRSSDYEAVVAQIAERTGSPTGPPYVCGVRLAAGAPAVGQLERDPGTLRAGAEAGRAEMRRGLGYG